jgi:hypothetical protein
VTVEGVQISATDRGQLHIADYERHRNCVCNTRLCAPIIRLYAGSLDGAAPMRHERTPDAFTSRMAPLSLLPAVLARLVWG